MNDTDNKRFFRYIAKPSQFLLVGALTLGTVIGGVLLSQFADPASESNAADVASAIDLYEPFTMLGTGLATSLLSPWIEERIYRGVILQGFLPHVGAPSAVCSLHLSLVQGHSSKAPWTLPTTTSPPCINMNPSPAPSR